MKSITAFGLGVLLTTGLAIIANHNNSPKLYESAHRAGYKAGYHQCNLFWARTLLEKKIIDSQSYTNLILQSTHALERP